MTKETLQERVSAAKDETRIALQTIFDALNKGQKAKLLKNAHIIELFDRYNVDYKEADT